MKIITLLATLTILTSCKFPDEPVSVEIKNSFNVTNAHVHEWSKWGDPIVEISPWSGNTFRQIRVCSTCNEAELKVTQVRTKEATP